MILYNNLTLVKNEIFQCRIKRLGAPSPVNITPLKNIFVYQQVIRTFCPNILIKNFLYNLFTKLIFLT
jgi:hypothetical protein